MMTCLSGISCRQQNTKVEGSAANDQRVCRGYGGVVSHTHLCNQSVCLAGTLSLVSLIFSFMLVWDMPAIRRGVQSLKQSRLSIVYEEIAPVIGTFGAIFGKAMQAQSAIAVVNTALTALGLLVLQVSGVGFLSVLVFLCSFVPVAGVIISTVPIGLVAFTESGLLQLGLVVLMVILIHAVEAYILNPVIYSGVYAVPHPS
jgi:predicted PurR-regulated permease PerM